MTSFMDGPSHDQLPKKPFHSPYLSIIVHHFHSHFYGSLDTQKKTHECIRNTKMIQTTYCRKLDIWMKINNLLFLRFTIVITR